ncbi:MAG: ATP-binding protein [Anaerolineales bacterium]
MKLVNLKIRNFRGIRDLDWNIKGNMICLIGSGDSTKSTILLALEYLFTPGWNLAVGESDFYQRKTDSPIEISAIVTDLPKKFLDEDKFGLLLGFFYNSDNGTVSESQEDNSHPAIMITLTIKDDFEPVWEVISPKSLNYQAEPRKINSQDRKLLGVARIGNYIDADLTWGRNSAISRLTSELTNQTDQVPKLLADLERQILLALRNPNLNVLSETIEAFKVNCQLLGIDSGEDLKAGIDPNRVSLRQGAIALLDGNLPLTLRGAGTRRLMAMAAHKASVKEGAIILIDEIENSLEPYRLRHLIRQLRPQEEQKHQVIFTTHSSVAIEECFADELFVVRNENGKIIIHHMDSNLQRVVRAASECFLARKIVVCEGKTEEGFLIGIEQNYWQPRRRQNKMKYQTLAESGITPVLGGGSSSPQMAADLLSLGYEVVFFGDSDKINELKISPEEMQKLGIAVVLWEKDDITGEGLAIEQRLCLDLPIDALTELINEAIKFKKLDDDISEERARMSVQDQLCEYASGLFSRNSVFDFITSLDESNGLEFRKLLGKTAKEKGWFKRRDKGEKLGELLSRYLDRMNNTPTEKTIKELEVCCYDRI